MPGHNPEDYAIVVGIRRYPGFGRTPADPNDLEGPDNDATDVYDWLVSAQGGGVPPGNAKLIRSADFAQPFPNSAVAEPQKTAIVAAFNALVGKSEANEANSGTVRVGRRLYLYMSGHGFAPKRKEGAVFVANATRTQTHHVFSTAWIDWFYNARIFDEFVLWMDCCMDFELSVIPEAVPYRIRQGTGPGGNMFSAFAARFPLQAVERQMPDGRYHGVFTHTLITGLRGPAANPDTRLITSESLRGYLTNAMKTFLSPTDLADVGISKEPDFGADDPIVFASVPPFTVGVNLSFPSAAEGKPFRIVTGRPLKAVGNGTVQNRSASTQLPVGLYFVVLESPPLVKEFEILGVGNVTVTV